MLVINGVKIAEASGGGDILIKTDDMNDFLWVDPSTASVIIGDEYFNNEELRKMITTDFDLAMSQCANL